MNRGSDSLLMNADEKRRWTQIGLDAAGVAVAAGLVWVMTWVFLDDALARIVGLVLLVGGIFIGIGSRRTFPGRHPTLLKWGVSALFVSAAVWVQAPPSPEAEIEWQPYSVNAIEQAAQEGRPVVIDFYADWCPPCRELDARVFTRKEVATELERFVRLRADLSDQSSPRNAEISERHSVSALPTVAFIGSDGRERLSMRLIGFESASRFLNRVRAIR